mmetsp:Transcript_24384/g.18535  ORF Transcript_24384/g.18535 Transcript_24384/m.18535 type:complete len:90 (-) Transcript_24384:74-343(-)
MPLSHFKGKNMWILKPTSLNRGKGIHVVGSLKKLKRLMRDYCKGREMSKAEGPAKNEGNAGIAPEFGGNFAQTEKAKSGFVMKHNTFIL